MVMMSMNHLDYIKNIYNGEVSPVLQRQAKAKDDAGHNVHHPWHQLESETGQAYAAFQIYLDMGPGRAQKHVSQVLYGTEDVAYQIKDWSIKYDWVKRSDAWDRFVAESHIESQHQAVREAESFALRRMPELVVKLFKVANGEETASRTQMQALRDALDRFGPAKQKSQTPLTIKNYNVTVPVLPEKSTQNLFDVEEADYEVIADEAESLIPKGLKK